MKRTRGGWTPARIAALVAGCFAPAVMLSPSQAAATSLATRTFDVSVLGAVPAGAASFAAADPSLSADGGLIAFDSPANAPGGAGSEVFTVDIFSAARTLISTTPGGNPANGSSTHPSVASGGQVVAFSSTATNLSTAASSGLSNVYVRAAGGPVTLLSVGLNGQPANGQSSQPVISADGRFVTFSSDATNLVPGDENRQTDVFVRDLAHGSTTRVSVASGGRQSNGPATGPAISANGRYVCFESTATTLTTVDANGLPDVFLRDLVSGITRRISVSSSGRQQNAAVAAPFHQVCSVTADGRYVAFDSNATNLVPGESTQARSNVFLRDVRRGRTTLLSESNAGREGNSDSFAPTITRSGRYVAFESFAGDLASGGGPRENIFVRDLRQGTTVVVDVGPQGQRLGPERVPQLLQHPPLTDLGHVAAFESTAANLTGPGPIATHVFLRLMDPPAGFFVRRPPRQTRSRRPRVVVGADDPLARVFSCQIDRGALFKCRRGSFRLPRLSPGRHVLYVRAGGPGMLFDPKRLRATFTIVS